MEKDKGLEELKKDQKQLEADFARLKEQIVGVQYVMNYVTTKIKQIETPDKKEG